MTVYPKITDMLPRPIRWRTIADYAVYNLDTNKLMVSPWLKGFHHTEASHQFDERHYLDWQHGINRAKKYLFGTKGKRL